MWVWSSLYEAIAAVAVVINAVLDLELLDVPELPCRVRTGHPVAQRLVGVQQNLLEAARQTHPLVPGQIREQRRQPFLQPDRDVHPFDRQRIAHGVDVVPEVELVAVKVANPVVAQAVEPVSQWHHDFDSAGAMEFVQLVGVTDHEVHRTSRDRKSTRLNSSHSQISYAVFCLKKKKKQQKKNNKTTKNQ